MKVLVLGAGIVGTTSAWYLAKEGHEVTVIDREAGPALETSFANAGQVSFGYTSPWAAPGIPVKALKWLLQKDAPLILHPRPSASMVTWMLQMLRNCTSGRYALNKGRMLRVSNYSRDLLAELRRETNITYDQRMQGTLQLFRTEAQVEASAKDVKALRADGVPLEVLDVEGCIKAEPALAKVRHLVAGGLRTPLDETGDCFKFTNELAEFTANKGVTFRWNENIRHLDIDKGQVKGVVTDRGTISADAVVVALGVHTRALVKPLNINLPIYPVKGYSLTIPIVDPDRAPESTVMDETYKIAITRLGDHIRVGGMAELSGYNSKLSPARRHTLERSVSELFPGGDLAKATFWTGMRPMTPDGTPIIGATPVKGLFLNTGHGTLGWTMATGSGRLIADLVSGRKPEIDHTDLSVARY